MHLGIQLMHCGMFSLLHAVQPVLQICDFSSQSLLKRNREGLPPCDRGHVLPWCESGRSTCAVRRRSCGTPPPVPGRGPSRLLLPNGGYGKLAGRPLDLCSGAPRPSLGEEPEPLLAAPGAAAPCVPPSDEDVRGTGVFRPDAEDPLVSAIDFVSWFLTSGCLLFCAIEEDEVVQLIPLF